MNHRSSVRRWRAAIFTGIATVCVALGTLFVLVGLASNRFIDNLDRDIAPPTANTEERVLSTFERVSRWRYFDSSRISSGPLRWLSRMEHASPLHVSARTALTAGADNSGPCGSVSRSMIVLLRRAKIPARKAILYTDDGQSTHTVVEVAIDGEWRVFDPTYAWVWRRPVDGRIATAADLGRDPQLLATILTEHPQYPLDLYHYRNVYHLRWEKIPGLPRIRVLLERWKGKEWVQAIGTPYVYERPNFLMAMLLWLVALLAFLLQRLYSRRPQLRRVSLPPATSQ